MKRIKNFSLLLAGVFLLAACNEKAPQPGPEEPAVLSDECKLISINAEGQIGETVPPSPGKTSFLMYIDAAIDPTAVNVEVEVSEGASIVPSPDQPIDFSSGSVTFTVTSESGIIDQKYVVNAVFQSVECKILSASIKDQYGETIMPEGDDNVIKMTANYFVDLSKVEVYMEVSEKAVLAPELKFKRIDFSNGPVEFTVTAECGLERKYIVQLDQRDLPPALPKDYPDDVVKVMSFNIRGEDVEDGENNWIYRKDEVVQMVKDHCPTVIGLQEASPMGEFMYFEEILIDNYRSIAYEVYEPYWDCMQILYNVQQVELLDKGAFWLSETPDELSLGWDANNVRDAEWAIFRHKATGKIFCHINTHLDHKGQVSREEGMRLIGSRFDKFNPEGYSEILTFDANCGVTNPCLSVLDGRMVNTRLVAPADKTDNYGTYNAFKYKNGGGSIIDHIYVSVGTEVLEYHTCIEDFGVPFISDHYPIYSLIRLK